MNKNPREWAEQADYDMDTAEFMYNGGRYFYAIFMCHLAIEKALKGIFIQKLDETPPKTHNLIFLAEKIKLELPENLYDFLFTLNGVSVPTRYPDDLRRLLKDYDKTKTKELLEKGKEALRWLKEKL